MKGKITFLTKAAALLFVALFTLTGARADELTVYDGTETNEYVPAYINGFYMRQNNFGQRRAYYTKSQYIIPATQLAAMTGGLITSVKFYTSSNAAYTTPNMTVYVKEVNDKYFSGTVTFETETSATTVYSGTLSVANSTTGELAITFNAPFLYNGGDLLIGMGNTETKSTTTNISFYGESNPNSCGCYGYSQNSQPTTTTNMVEFLPKTTFSYVHITASHIGPNSAIISWGNLANATGYNLRCRELVFYDDFKNLDNWTIYTEGEHLAGMAGWWCYGGKAASYGWNYSNDTALNADNWLVSPLITLQGGNLEFDVLTDASYTDQYEVLFATTGNTVEDFTATTATTLRALAAATSGPISIDLSAFANQTGYVAFHHKCDNENSGSYLDIDNFHIYTERGITRNGITSPQTLEDLTPSTSYEVEVQAVYAQGVSGWARTFFTTSDGNPIPAEIIVSPAAQSATIEWFGLSDSYEVKYRGAVPAILQGFEDNSFGDWTTIDADGDGKGWDVSSVNPHSGSYVASSASFENNVGPLTPDNWLVSPLVTLGGSISFWAKGRDKSWSSEVFGVAVSTTGNTNPADFTMVGASKTATGEWTQYVFDLGAYNGEGYIAIRHYNVTDMFYLDIDDINISKPGNWMTATTTTNSVTLTGLVPNTEYEFTVIGIKDGIPNAGSPVTSFTTLNGDFTVTVGSVGYTTFVAPFNISELPEGLEAYACQTNTTDVHLEPVTAIPEGEAVVLKKTGTYILTPASGSVELGTDNDLLPSDGTIQGASNIYALANKSQGVGFYPVASTVKVPAGKGYLLINRETPVKGFYGFEEDDDPTGISNVNVNVNDNLNNAIYNLAGQRMGKTQKGINIVNGKKILK